MSGHSKWANIKHRKAKQDAQRGKIFTKLGRELILAARAGGGDPATNLRLKMAVNKAREANMPMENITRAIKRGTGEIEGAAYEEVVYEGYGPGGVAVMLSAATDNRNRTAAEIRHIFSKNGGSLGESGCVAWMFSRKGVLNLEETALDEDELLMLALEAGAEDLRLEGGVAEIITAPEDFEKVRDSLARSGLTFTRAEVTMVPQNVVSVSDRQQADAILRLVDLLEDHDDVQEVYANFDIPDAIMDSL
ncbi:MAG: YebC/PmpR family DNA-binding transcriptional regulator [Syntrophomonadaceae bacterium]|nr:YebC/PmpR family DNA-binding transcriptional regulator [Syntrophomonadaceae bacterium]